MSTQIEAFAPTAVSRAAPASGWRRMLGDWMVVSSATVICQVLGAANALLLRKVMGPTLTGAWQALSQFLDNSNYANLGISKGAVREFTIALGRGRPAEAQLGLNLAHTVNTLTSLLYAALLAGAGLWIGLCGGGSWARTWAIGLSVVGLLAVVQRYANYQVTLLRAKQDFASTSQLSILEGLLTLVLTVPATWLWGLPGLYGGTLAVLYGSIWFTHTHGAIPMAWAWQRREIRRLIGIGSPILLASFVSTVFRSLDTWMVLAYLKDGFFQLGCYSLALMLSGQLYGLGNVLSIVIGPRLAEHYGHCGSRRDVARLSVYSNELLAAAIALPAALAMVAVPPLLGTLLPDYRAGLLPMLWLIPGAIGLTLALVPGQYLVAVDRQNWSLYSVLLATGIAALGNHLALRGGFGLQGVAIATSGSYLAYFVLTAIPLWLDLDRVGRLRFGVMHALVVIPTLAVAGLLELARPAAAVGLTAMLAKAGLVTIVWGMTLAVGWQYGGWREAIRKRTARV
jgi:O-antigen/teichoic acid export membrane protein